MRLSLLLVAALLLAGCASPAADDATLQDADGNATAPAPADLPPEEERVDDGTRTDLGHMPHMHDYWKGKERVTLFDGTVEPSPVDENAFMTLVVQKEPRMGGSFWFLPEGAIVYEGTGQMDVTASWTDPRTTSVGVSFRTPGSQEFGPVTPLANGEPLTLDVTPAMTDMPHSKTSRWAFYFAPGESPGAAMGPFDLKVEVMKLRDISLFPAHPELFEGKPQKTLHDADHQHSEVSYPKRVPNLLTAGEFGEKEVTPSQLVPMETQWMRVEVDLTDATASPGQVSDIRFFYKGADRNFISHPYTLPTEGSLAEKRLVYEWPVTMEMTDTPYGEESQWRFFVEPVTTFTGQEGEPNCGGCTDVSIAYHLKVTAYDHVPEGAVASKMEGDESG